MIRGSEGEIFPLFPLDRMQDAFAAYCAHRWPSSRRKSVEREFDLSPHEARMLCEGRASQSTIDRVLTHKNGGWSVIFPVFGALLGQTADQFLEKEKARHADHAQRLGALVCDLRAIRPVRHPADPGADRERTFRRDAGAVGAAPRQDR